MFGKYEVKDGVLYLDDKRVLFVLTEEDVFSDDFTRIHNPNCEDCRYTEGGIRERIGKKAGIDRPGCKQDNTDIYTKIYNHLDHSEKDDRGESERDYVDNWIFGNLLYESPGCVKQAIDDNCNVDRHLKELGIEKPKCMK